MKTSMWLIVTKLGHQVKTKLTVYSAPRFFQTTGQRTEGHPVKELASPSKCSCFRGVRAERSKAFAGLRTVHVNRICRAGRC